MPTFYSSLVPFVVHRGPLLPNYISRRCMTSSPDNEGGHNFKPIFTILKKMKEKEREVRILMLGLDNAGKTTILKKFNGEDINTISPTLGFNIKTLEHQGLKMNIWDVGGQKSLRSYWRNYFESTDGLVWVVDSADCRRFEDCRQELAVLLQEEKLTGATLLVFANKQDLPGALRATDIREVSSSNQSTMHFILTASIKFSCNMD
uniref:ADP-ribosylation factor-like protein 14 n=1 Tax=Eptatretus burgeri TaxID=7764 RepID=A0A8C4R2E9_EPTBU